MKNLRQIIGELQRDIILERTHNVLQARIQTEKINVLQELLERLK